MKDTPAFGGASDWISALRPQLATAAPAGSRADLSGWQVHMAASSGGDDPNRTVRAGRRRRTQPPGPEGRERAEAPERQKPSSSAAPPPSSAGPRPPVSSPRPSAGLPGGGRMSPLMMIGLLVLLVVCGVPAMLLFGGGDSGQETVQTQPIAEPTLSSVQAIPQAPTATPRPAAPRATATAASGAIVPKPAATKPVASPAAATDGQTWTVMLYQDADDKILEQDIYIDLNEAERVGSNDTVQIVAQVDRYRAGYQGDGDWTSAKRFYITRDDDLQRVRSRVVQDLGEINMADGQTLVDFVAWAAQNYPADRYVLILSDHGMGWPGGWSDPEPRGRVDRNIPLTSALGDQLYLNEFDQALQDIRDQVGIDRFELIGLDACLMGHLEVLSALAPHTRHAVISQETEPALGWAYTSFLGALQENPAMDGAELGRLIVDSYIQEDQRIVDEQARAEFVGRGSPMGSLFGPVSVMSADQVARQLERNITLTAVDLSALPELMASTNDLAMQLQQVRQNDVAQARTYAQSFTSIFGKDVPASYIDLGNFAQAVAQASRNRNVTQAADQVLTSLGQLVVAEKHGPNKPGASGVSIYFPNSQLYRNPMAGAQSYTAIARRFAQESLWDDFLAFHYTGRRFEPTAAQPVAPEPGAAVRAPGASAITISPLRLSDDVAAPGRPVLLSADISGDNIGHIYFFTGFYDPNAASIFVADQDYLESAETREVDGVYYPDWGEGAFTLEFEWEPLMYAISDGANRVQAALMPETYGAAPEDAVYTVDGVYTYTEDGESRHARLYFRDGQLRQVFGFTGEQADGTGAPREIIPQPGDTFTVLEKWLDVDASGQAVQAASQQGGTLTFGNQMFEWLELDAAVGDYVVGFIVEDMDGNTTAAYQRVAVE